MQPRILYAGRLSIRMEGDKKELPGQAESKRICDHQTSPTRNINILSKQRESPKVTKTRKEQRQYTETVTLQVIQCH